MQLFFSPEAQILGGIWWCKKAGRMAKQAQVIYIKNPQAGTMFNHVTWAGREDTAHSTTTLLCGVNVWNFPQGCLPLIDSGIKSVVFSGVYRWECLNPSPSFPHFSPSLLLMPGFLPCHLSFGTKFNYLNSTAMSQHDGRIQRFQIPPPPI